jgi:hypothetical protein
MKGRAFTYKISPDFSPSHFESVRNFHFATKILVPLDVSVNDIKLNECYVDIFFCAEPSVMKLCGYSLR